MNPRTLTQNRQGFGCSFGSLVGLEWGVGLSGFTILNNMLRKISRARQWREFGAFSKMSECADHGVDGANFPFSLSLNRVESKIRKTLIRGYAVCVNHPFFSRHLPHLALRPVSATTPIRPPITQLCAPSVEPLQAPLLPMQPVAAKPKARLLARWSVVCHVASRACLLATDSGLTTNRLTGPHQSGAKYSIGPFGGFSRAAFLHFRASGALPRKGCHV